MLPRCNSPTPASPLFFFLLVLFLISCIFSGSQIVDGVHGVIFPKHNSDALLSSFSQMISDGKLSRFAQAIASSGRLLAKNILASECVAGYAQLLENVLNFPSDVKLPGSVSQLQLGAWEWNLFRKEMVKTIDENADDEERIAAISKSSVIFALEVQLTNSVNLTNLSETENGPLEQDIPTSQDWDILEEIENAEEYETVEMEEVYCGYHSSNCNTCSNHFLPLFLNFFPSHISFSNRQLNVEPSSFSVVSRKNGERSRCMG